MNSVWCWSYWPTKWSSPTGAIQVPNVTVTHTWLRRIQNSLWKMFCKLIPSLVVSRRGHVWGILGIWFFKNYLHVYKNVLKLKLGNMWQVLENRLKLLSWRWTWSTTCWSKLVKLTSPAKRVIRQNRNSWHQFCFSRAQLFESTTNKPNLCDFVTYLLCRFSTD